MLHSNSPQVPSLQAGVGSDPPEREDTSILLSEWYECVLLNSADVPGGCTECTNVWLSSITDDEAVLNDLCWVPFGVKTLPIESQGGTLYLQPPRDELGEKKENTIFVEVPPGAVDTSADVKMRYAIIPSGSFTLPEGYQLGSMVVYIYYDGQRVTKPLNLHLPDWYGGEDCVQDGLSFAIASHSLKGKQEYHFQLLAGGEFPDSPDYGVVEIGGHCSLFAKVFKMGAKLMYQAFCLEKEKEEETEFKIAVTYATPYWPQVMYIISTALFVQNTL